MIDMHCHLDLYKDPFHVVAEAAKKGVSILSVTTTPSAWNGTFALAKGHSCIKTALGLHPQIAHQRYNELNIFDELVPNVEFVGEIGLEGSAGWKEHLPIQTKVFRHILDKTQKAGGRTMSIHSRSAVTLVLDELEKYPDAGVPIMHWFTGTKTQVKRAIDFGCWFSVNLPMIRSKKGQSLLKIIPKERVLTETDGPFAKYKRVPLNPWDVSLCNEPLSEIWGVSQEESQNQVQDNFNAL